MLRTSPAISSVLGINFEREGLGLGFLRFRKTFSNKTSWHQIQDLTMEYLDSGYLGRAGRRF